MKCSDARRWLHEYVDGQANPMQERMLKAHLSECPDCRARLQELRCTNAALRSLEPMEAPEGFTGRVMAALPEGAFRTERVPWYRRRAFWYQVAAATIIFLILFGSAQALLPQSVSRPVVISQVDTSPLVREDGVIRLPEGRTLNGDVTIVGGTLVVAGTIRGNIKMIGAKLVTTETAEIHGDVSSSSGGIELFWYSIRAAWYNFLDSVGNP